MLCIGPYPSYCEYEEIDPQRVLCKAKGKQQKVQVEIRLSPETVAAGIPCRFNHSHAPDFEEYPRPLQCHDVFRHERDVCRGNTAMCGFSPLLVFLLHAEVQDKMTIDDFPAIAPGWWAPDGNGGLMHTPAVREIDNRVTQAESESDALVYAFIQKLKENM